MPLKRLLIILYICLIGLLAAATFIEQAYGTEAFLKGALEAGKPGLKAPKAGVLRE